ncbi:MAG: hypothetical protein ACYDCI_02530 [Candidatus Limnocylindrales bacterium]
MTRTRRGSTAALTTVGVRGQLRRQFLQFYDSDVAFRAGLTSLWAKQARRLTLAPDWREIVPVIWVEKPSARAVRDEFESRGDVNSMPLDERARAWDEAFGPVAVYLDALADLAERFGLDRLGIEGVDTIHAWCCNRQETIAIGGHWPAWLFSEGYQNFGPVVEVGDVVECDLGVLELDGSPIAIKEQDVRPVVRVDGRESRWDPTLEPRRLAFSRLRRRFGKRHEPTIRAELDRLASLGEDAGASPIDTRANVGRDLQWLFWHIRHREGPAQVAARAGLRSRNVAMVRQAVWRIARLAEVSLHPGWSDWPEV